jgi:hypothetical protein
MTTPHKDFDTPSDGAPAHSGTFSLGGRTWKIRHRDDIPFEIVKRLMGQTPAADGDSDAEQAERAREVVLQTGPFFEATIMPDEVPAFMAMFEDSKSPLTIGKLRPVMEYVSEVAFSEGERPTKPSRRSPAGRSATGRTSEAGSSSQATRRARSAS